ncbi:coiled-coil domain-containing protein [Mycoplasmopsis lipofaciens]|uniref:hypothetical protein n=1 Tax=Mycoplasmopsis lipofaciens TaxID=114884 RepID=UPI000485A49C|nr:hypothetical protein [Mycoplasmopsis lipofaciens]
MTKESILEIIGVSLNGYNRYFNIAKEFRIPSKLKKFYSNNTEEEINDCFINIAGNIFNQIDVLLSMRLSWAVELSKRNDKFILFVSPQRAENLVKAIYEEISFRILSNSFPEFNNKLDLLIGGLNRVGFARDYSSIESVLSPIPAGLIINSAWNKFNIEQQKLNSKYLEYIEQKIQNIERNLNQNEDDDTSQSTKIEANKNNIENANNLINVNKQEINTLKQLNNNFVQEQQEQNSKIANLEQSKTLHASKIASIESLNQDQSNLINQLNLSLQANSNNDADTLKKFNQLSTEYISKNAELKTEITTNKNTIETKLDKNIWDNNAPYAPLNKLARFNADIFIDNNAGQAVNRLKFIRKDNNTLSEIFYENDNMIFASYDANSKVWKPLISFHKGGHFNECELKKYIDDSNQNLTNRLNSLSITPELTNKWNNLENSINRLDEELRVLKNKTYSFKAKKIFSSSWSEPNGFQNGWYKFLVIDDDFSIVEIILKNNNNQYSGTQIVQTQFNDADYKNVFNIDFPWVGYNNSNNYGSKLSLAHFTLSDKKLTFNYVGKIYDNETDGIKITEIKVNVYSFEIRS